MRMPAGAAAISALPSRPGSSRSSGRGGDHRAAVHGSPFAARSRRPWIGERRPRRGKACPHLDTRGGRGIDSEGTSRDVAAQPLRAFAAPETTGGRRELNAS
jgi:hypothetical protein